MANVKVYNMSGAEVGTIDLSDDIFGIEASEHAMHMAVVQYLANQRQGTQSAKPVLKYAAAAENPGDRKVLAGLDRAPSVHLSGRAAALCLLQSLGIIPLS